LSPAPDAANPRSLPPERPPGGPALRGRRTHSTHARAHTVSSVGSAHPRGGSQCCGANELRGRNEQLAALVAFVPLLSSRLCRNCGRSARPTSASCTPPAHQRRAGAEGPRCGAGRCP